MSNRLTTLCGASRLPFLVLSVVCVLLGAATAAWSGGRIEPLPAGFALLAAVTGHAAVNLLNEYFDFRSGLDLTTVRTPFSGGSGALPAAPGHAGLVLAAGLGALLVTGLIGIWFVLRMGGALLPLGALGLLLVVAYTPWVTARAAVSLVAPGLGFGPVMVAGSAYALTGTYPAAAWAASIVPFFLANGLLLLNQFPDVEADRRVGRRNLPIVLGPRRSALVYAALVVAAYAALAGAVLADVLPHGAAWGFATLPLALPSLAGAWRHGAEPARLPPYLGLNVGVSVLTPLLMGLGILFG
jgi:1,4-dihydroxy-2-naphthoate octaprenyltransferase